jgi:prevent-host-death family protein
MSEEISLYQAKATLSALVRAVREGGASYTITVHGQPVAELRPLEPKPPRKQTLAERIAELKATGQILEGKGSPKDLLDLPPRPYIPGALERFLEERE